MAHEFLPSPDPRIVLIRMFGELEEADLKRETSLGLDEDNQVYILLDASDMVVNLPPHFLEHIRFSPLLHQNLLHIAVYTRSATCSALVRVVGRLTGRGYKLSTHTSREAALNHLLKLVNSEQHMGSKSATT